MYLAGRKKLMRMSLEKRIQLSLRRFSISWWIVPKHLMCPWLQPLYRFQHPSNQLRGVWPKVIWLHLPSNKLPFDAPCPLPKSPTAIKSHIDIIWVRFMCCVVNCCGLYKLYFILDLQDYFPLGVGRTGLASEDSESCFRLLERAKISRGNCKCPMLTSGTDKAACGNCTHYKIMPMYALPLSGTYFTIDHIRVKSLHDGKL